MHTPFFTDLRSAKLRHSLLLAFALLTPCLHAQTTGGVQNSAGLQSPSLLQPPAKPEAKPTQPSGGAGLQSPSLLTPPAKSEAKPAPLPLGVQRIVATVAGVEKTFLVLHIEPAPPVSRPKGAGGGGPVSKVATDQRVGTAFALPPDFVLANYPNAEEMAEGGHVECLAKRAGVVEWTPKNSKQPRRLPRFDFFEPPPQKKQ